MDDVDINASNKVSFGKKVFEYFFGYKDNEKVKPLCVMLPKIQKKLQIQKMDAETI